MYIYNASSQIAQWVKNLSAMQKTQETQVQSLSWEDHLEKGLAIHSSILTWRIPWTVEPDRLQSIRSQRIRQEWSDWAKHSTAYCIFLSCIKMLLFEWLHDKSSKVWRWSLFEDDTTFKMFGWLLFRYLQRYLQFRHSVMSSFCDTMDCSTSALPVHHQLLEVIQTFVHWGYWYVSWKSRFKLVFHPVQHFSWCTLNIS